MLKQIPIKAQAGGKESQGSAEVRIWTVEEQSSRARKAAGISFGLAFVSIFLPLVHFVLVPGFLLLTPFVYRWFKKQSGRFMKVTASCPHCGKDLVANEGNLEWPLRFACQSCFEQVRVEPV